MHAFIHLLLPALVPPALAQGSGFQTPGMPQTPQLPAQAPPAESGQTDRFSSVFNPAVSFVLDGFADYLDADGSSADGAALELRSGEVGLAAWVDPSAWAFGTIVFAEEETALEEGALNWLGLGGHRTLKAGRFFVDFGKQMQAHVHELRTLERPLPLRAYLGDELGGDGLQLDDWWSVGESSAVRASIGVFHSLLGEIEDDPFAATPFDEDRKDLNELGFTARVTGFSDVGQNGVLQVGASARHLPDFGFALAVSAAPGAVRDGLSNTVLGLDATYGWTDATATRKWTVGAEALAFSGDVGADVVDAGVIGDPTDDVLDVFDDTVFGAFAFVDRQWSPRDSAGLQASHVELPASGSPEAQELDLYYTRMLSEFHRLRFVVSVADSDVDGESTRVAVQYTGFVGAHAHGINW